MLKSRLLVLAAAALWSTGGAAIKIIGLDGWQIAAGRSLVAGLFLAAVFRDGRARPGLHALGVAVAYAITTVLFVLATKLTTSANAIFIQDTAPLWVLLLSPWLLHERPTRGELLAIPIYAVGLGLFFLDELTAGQVAGNVVAALAGVSFAFSIVGFRRLRGGATPALVWGNALAAAATLPLWARGPSATWADLGLVLYLCVFQLGLAYFLFARGLGGTPAIEASLLALLEPVLNPIWTYLAAGERPGPWALAGGAVVLAATVWRTLAPVLTPREVGDLVAPRHRVRVPERHHAAHVHRLERQVAEEVLSRGAGRADALQEVPQHRGEAAVLVLRELPQVLGRPEDERGNGADVEVAGLELLPRHEGEGPVHALQPLEVRVEEIQEHGVQEHARDLGERHRGRLVALLPLGGLRRRSKPALTHRDDPVGPHVDRGAHRVVHPDAPVAVERAVDGHRREEHRDGRRGHDVIDRDPRTDPDPVRAGPGPQVGRALVERHPRAGVVVRRGDRHTPQPPRPQMPAHPADGDPVLDEVAEG
jgi:DME family drug/metabolite transporter